MHPYPYKCGDAPTETAPSPIESELLELFVLTIKMGETPCDYDLVVEHQLSHKRLMLQKTEDSLRN